MKAKFQIENVHDAVPAFPVSFVFSQRGGLIGSASDATWRIQDSEGAIPETAARIMVSDGHFTIERVSNANIRVNRAKAPIPTGRPVILSDKDEVQIENLKCTVSTGQTEYLDARPVSVHSMVGADHGKRDRLVRDSVYVEARPVDEAPARETRDDPLDVLDERRVSRQQTDPLSAFSDAQRARQTDDEILLQDDVNLHRGAEPRVTNSQQDDANMHFASMPNTRIRRDRYGFEEPVQSDNTTSARSSRASESPIDAVSVDLPHAVDHVALRPLAKSLGIHLGEMSTEQAARVLSDIGASLRAALEGLNQIYKSTSERSANFPLATMHLHALEDNPIRFSSDTDEALHAFFSKRGPVHLSAPAAMQESLDHLNSHQAATEKSIDRALDAVLAALLPRALERRFKAYDAAGVPESQEAYDAWCWRMYRAYFSELRSQRQQGLQMLFWEVFGNEYRATRRHEQMQRDLGEENERDIEQ
ncbi:MULTISPECIES: type VI secretion system-associated FHA domain protein TagH [unclassified Thalassospira]|uniref:type VI secretion system-associated FHA domain protein TagH n=1 Tax=unclassified Thalassospira TaxID=2648997 RepID=UPI000A1DEBAC|nr:type VI secretion system-associated FHA domain protein TagH [Thalassospira sp. MCCC 1A01428]OSQ42979.1 hypothetical protein THS27_12530 [Thalassospira sp. MCCC 1A01428]